MKKLLFVSLFYALSMQGMGIHDPQTLLMLSRWNKSAPKASTSTGSSKKKNLPQDYKTIKKDERLQLEKDDRSWQNNFFSYLCCCARKP